MEMAYISRCYRRLFLFLWGILSGDQTAFRISFLPKALRACTGCDKSPLLWASLFLLFRFGLGFKIGDA